MRCPHSSGTGTLVGPRAKIYRDGEDILAEAQQTVKILHSSKSQAWESLFEMKAGYAVHCRAYYTLAALSRRRVLDESLRCEVLHLLFPLRSLIEQTIYRDLLKSERCFDVLAMATGQGFFGFSAKQGVGIRYPIASCIPTEKCGGRCYAHDGRDREINHIFRGVLNWYVGKAYESGNEYLKNNILRRLDRAITAAIKSARKDQDKAASLGFSRDPRIRFSHVGEMVETPDFTSRLAYEIQMRDPFVRCILYTRHYRAADIDIRRFVMNFTLDGIADSRRKLAPKGAIIVSSAWDGEIIPGACVNFLEHHVEKVSKARAKGSICPVTASHHNFTSCDEARCDICFRPRCSCVQ